MVNERTVTKKWTVVLRQRSSEEGNTQRVTRTMPQFVDKGGNIFKFSRNIPVLCCLLSARGRHAASTAGGAKWWDPGGLGAVLAARKIMDILFLDGFTISVVLDNLSKHGEYIH